MRIWMERGKESCRFVEQEKSLNQKKAPARYLYYSSQQARAEKPLRASTLVVFQLGWGSFLSNDNRLFLLRGRCTKPNRPIKYQLLRRALSLSSYQPQGAWPVLLSQTRTYLNVREEKGRPLERTDRRDRLKLSLSRAASLLDRRGGASQSMGQRIKRFDFVPRDPPQVGFESRVMVCAGEWKPPLSSKKEAALPTAECIILHFPKRTFIHFFLPRRPRRLKRRYKSRPGNVRGRRAGKRVESIRLDDREKQNEIRIWLKKKQHYGYHDRSPSRKKNLSKSLRVSGAHPKYAGVVNDIAFLIENDDSSRKTKLFKFFFPKKSRSGGPTSHILKRTLPAVRPSLNYSAMQYLWNTKNKMHFDPIVVLNHFVAPGVAEPSTMGGANEQGGSLDKRIRSRIGFFVESSTSEKKCFAEAGLTHFIRLANDLRFAGTTKTTISLFPFFGATFFFPRDGVRYNKLFLEDARKQLLGQLGIICWNLMGKEKKIDYAPAEVSTRYGISGVKVRISYSQKNKGRAISETAGRLSYRAIEAARRATIGQFHRAMSGKFRRNGKIWVRVLADLPITGKPTEVRMGRGKGNPTGWIARVSTGQIPFEMDGVSLSNARQAATLAVHKPSEQAPLRIISSMLNDEERKELISGKGSLLYGRKEEKYARR
ncbi:hypothetical protein ACLOJK_038586 [Asimina triloba]